MVFRKRGSEVYLDRTFIFGTEIKKQLLISHKELLRPQATCKVTESMSGDKYHIQRCLAFGQEIIDTTQTVGGVYLNCFVMLKTVSINCVKIY